MTGVYMAKISTEFGIHWFCIGEAKNDIDAMKKAMEYTMVKLHGSGSQVKEVMPKLQWIREVRPTSCIGRGKSER